MSVHSCLPSVWIQIQVFACLPLLPQLSLVSLIPDGRASDTCSLSLCQRVRTVPLRSLKRKMLAGLTPGKVLTASPPHFSLPEFVHFVYKVSFLFSLSDEVKHLRVVHVCARLHITDPD